MPKGTALVTGASTGIGAVYADRLARRGHDLILVARDKARLASLKARLEADTGRKAEILAADLTAKADLEAVEKRLASDASIAVLVNNAGMAASGHLAGSDSARNAAMIDLNIVALTRLAAAASANFSAKGRGAIINIGSVLGLAPERFNAIYSASKAYVLAFSQTLNVELAEMGVRIQAVLPGATRTEIWERAGIDVATYPPEMVMDVSEMVDAALAGFDQGELVTIPSLPNAADWQAFEAARAALGPNLSLQHAAGRYKAPAAA
jgi:hypothetical protein